MSDFTLNVETRDTFRKAAARRMRRIDDKVPAIIYGGKEEPTAIAIPHNIISHALENEAFYSSILTINLDGKKQEQVIVKAVQRHPYKPTILHMDFFRINAKEKITMLVPLHFTNEEDAPGVREGGVVSHHQSELEISCLPANLPEFIQVDLAKMGMDDVIHLSQVKLPKGVELVAAAIIKEDATHDHAVVSIHKPVIKAEPVEEEEGAEGEAEADEASTDGEKPDESGEESKSEK